MSGEITVDFQVVPVEGKQGQVTVTASMGVPEYNRVTKKHGITKISSDSVPCADEEIPGYCCVALMQLLDKAASKAKVAK
jgi:hypothetical protein